MISNRQMLSPQNVALINLHSTRGLIYFLFLKKTTSVS